MLCLLLGLVCNVVWAQMQPSTILPDKGKPEHVYTMMNGNNVYANGLTAPTQTAENYGLFAFYAVDGVDGAYYIYSHTAKKWLTYTKAASYSNSKDFVKMGDDKVEGAYFKVEKYSGELYQMMPYNTSGPAAKYLNWYQGLDGNPLDGTNTLGLWEQNGSTDAGSRYTFTEVVIAERTYTISIPDGQTIKIGNDTYKDGDTYTTEGSVSKSDITVVAPEGKFAAVAIDDVNETINVYFATLPTQPATVAYTNAVLYPAQQTAVGVAKSEEKEGVYTLSNNVLAASFMRLGDAIYFAGSEAMDLVAGTEPFTVAFGNGDNVPASAMTLTSLELVDLKAKEGAIGGAEHYAGKALVANYEYSYKESKIAIVWRAVLRDGSHYLRTEMELTGVDDVDMYNIIPMIYNVDTKAAGSTPATVGNTRGKVIMSNKIFAGLETPTAYNTVGGATGEEDNWNLVATPVTETLEASAWTAVDIANVPMRIQEVGGSNRTYCTYSKTITLKKDQKVTTTLTYKSGSKRFDIDGTVLLDGNGAIAASDYHHGYSGTAKENNIYSFIAPNDGEFTVCMYIDKREGDIVSTSEFKVEVYEAKEGVVVNSDIVGIQGRWSRNTTLPQGETWKVGAVVGLIAQDGTQANTDIHTTQKRRSFLAYSERERAVPWRAVPAYVAWYELQINRNNAAPGREHLDNTKADDVLDVMSHWKSDFYDRYGIAPSMFVIDDGWDLYGEWTFHSAFPNELRDMASAAKEMDGAGIGAWLGPVGGYGQSGTYRRQYWIDKGQKMELSNPEYYAAFKKAAHNLVVNQGDNYTFFKFDGISGQFSSVGPDAGDVGNENAEGIIRLERYVREELREDIFFNTTVGTWASPFWYQISDATWRQENDYDEIGNNSLKRENWITYRDNLVHQNYVDASPICPINTLMTHGFILTKFGPPAGANRDYESVRRELRAAFLCGSGIVELYNDYDLMNSINGGALWADIAECIAWQKRNADVLPDIHWVGGDPWTGSKAEVYGWAAWNGTKSTLALRNGANDAQTYTFTLRQALNIPKNVNGSIILRSAFGDQAALTGLTEGTAINIDTELTVTLPGSSIYAFEGIDATAEKNNVSSITLAVENEATEVMMGKTLVVKAAVNADATFPAIAWTSSDDEIATVAGGLVKPVKEGTVTITATAKDGSGKTASVTITVTPKAVDMDAPVVTDLAQLSNDKVYTLSSARAFLFYKEGANKLYSSNGTAAGSVTLDKTNPNHQFRIEKIGENYYLYSVGAEKYVAKDGSYVATATDALTLTDVSSTNADYPWQLALGGNGMNSQDPGQTAEGIKVDSWTTTDAGNCYKIEVGVPKSYVYTVTILGDDEATVTYNEQAYENGATFETEATLKTSDFAPSVVDGKFAVVNIDANTIYVSYLDNATKFYTIKNGKGGYVSLSEGYTNGGNLLLSKTDTPKDNKGLWMFVEQAKGKYKVYNYSTGLSKVLGITGTEAAARTTMVADGVESYSTLFGGTFNFGNSEPSYMKIDGTTSQYWNNRDGYLALWNSTGAIGDTGSKFYLTEADRTLYPDEYIHEISDITGIETYEPKNPNTLWYTTSAEAAGVSYPWMEYALPLGNGELGCMVFGGVAHEELQFNEKTLWSGPANTVGAGGGNRTFMNFGSLIIANNDASIYTEGVTDYVRYLDIEEGIAGVEFKNANGTKQVRKYLSSAPDQVIVGQYKSEGDDKLDLFFTLEPGNGINASAVTYEDGTASFTGTMTVKYAARLHVVADENATITTTNAGISVKDATEVTFFLKGGTNFNGDMTVLDNYFTTEEVADVDNRVKSEIVNAIEKGFDAIETDHVADFTAITKRMTLDLGLTTPTVDTKTLIDNYYPNNSNADSKQNDHLFLEQLYFHYGRYLAISSNRKPIAAPNNLQGIWNDRGTDSPWNSDIHTNINIQMNYWPTEITNLSDLHKPFVNFIIRGAQSEGWKKVGTQYNDGYGWSVLTETSLYNSMSTWGANYLVANVWYTSHLWMHWRYTQDKEFLKQAFPVMWSAAEFWFHRLIEDRGFDNTLDEQASVQNYHTPYKYEPDGTFVAPDEFSAEQHDNQTEDGTAHAQQMIYYLFTNIKEAIDILGGKEAVNLTDEDIAKLDLYLEKTDQGLHTETYTGSWGATYNGVKKGEKLLREWKYSPFDISNDRGHRHMSHMMALFPMDQITPESEYFTPAVNSLKLRGDAATGWSMGWKVNLWARAQDGDHAHIIIKNALKHSTSYGTNAGAGGIYYNLFDSHAPFQIDGNFGVCSGIAEMLMQSAHGYINILPALPTVWERTGNVTGMKAIGNFTVDFNWIGGKAQKVRIVSNAGAPLKVRSTRGDIAKALITVNGVEVAAEVDENGIATIPCEQGDVVEIDFTQENSGGNEGGDVEVTTEDALPGDGTLRFYRLAIPVTLSAYTEDLGKSYDNVLAFWQECEDFVNEVFIPLGMCFDVVMDERLVMTEHINDLDKSEELPGIGNCTNLINDVIGADSYDVGMWVTHRKAYVENSGLSVESGVYNNTTKGSGYAKTDKWVVAHEIGHLFGAPHTTTGEGSLMDSGGDNFFSYPSIKIIRNKAKGTASYNNVKVANNAPQFDTDAMQKTYRIPQGACLSIDVQAIDAEGHRLQYTAIGCSSANVGNIIEGGTKPSFASFVPQESNVIRYQPRFTADINYDDYYYGMEGTDVPNMAAGTYPLSILVNDVPAKGKYNYASLVAEPFYSTYAIWEASVEIVSGTAFTAALSPAKTAYTAGDQVTVSWGANSSYFTEDSSVRISLSTDYGKTFSHVLAESVPALTGSYTVTMPNVNVGTVDVDFTTAVRQKAGGIIKVEEVGGAAYTLTTLAPNSNNSFTITGGTDEPKVIEAAINKYEIGTFYANEAVEIPEGLTAYVTITAPDMNGTEGTITMSKIEGVIIPAKTGVVIRGAEGTYTFKQTYEASTAVSGNLLMGYAGTAEYAQVPLPTDGSINYVLTVMNDKVGFYRKEAGFKVYNHKAYLNVPGAQNVRSLTIRFGDDDDATAIGNSTLNSHPSIVIYDLTGRRVEKMEKGIYIVNGKKVIR